MSNSSSSNKENTSLNIGASQANKITRYLQKANCALPLQGDNVHNLEAPLLGHSMKEANAEYDCLLEKGKNVRNQRHLLVGHFAKETDTDCMLVRGEIVHNQKALLDGHVAKEMDFEYDCALAKVAYDNANMECDTANQEFVLNQTNRSPNQRKNKLRLPKRKEEV